MGTLTLAAFTGASRCEKFFALLFEGNPIAWICAALCIFGVWLRIERERTNRASEVVNYPSIFKTMKETIDCENEKPCPNCQQSLPRDASFCKHCREFLKG